MVITFTSTTNPPRKKKKRYSTNQKIQLTNPPLTKLLLQIGKKKPSIFSHQLPFSLSFSKSFLEADVDEFFGSNYIHIKLEEFIIIKCLGPKYPLEF